MQIPSSGFLADEDSAENLAASIQNNVPHCGPAINCLRTLPLLSLTGAWERLMYKDLPHSKAYEKLNLQKIFRYN